MTTELRARAEQLLKNRQANSPDATNAELQEIVHELNVHEIELSLQNEELAQRNFDLEVLKQQAERSRNAFNQLFNITPNGFVIIDHNGLIYHCNATALTMLKAQERYLLRRPFSKLVAPIDQELFLGRFKSFIQKPVGKSIELRLLDTYGGFFYVQITGNQINEWRDLDLIDSLHAQESEFFLLSLVDIDARKKVEEKLLLSDSVFEYSSEGIMVTDSNNKIISVNPAFTEISGYESAEIIGENPRALSSGQHDSAFYQDMWDSISKSRFWKGEIINKRKNGILYTEKLAINQLNDQKGKPYRYIGVFSDITSDKELQQLIEYQATHDPLTKLPNRTLFKDRLQQAIFEAKRKETQFALLFFDLDGFKTLNDTLGHNAGDSLLIAIADRLNGMFRGSDTFARLGGDEFVVILNEFTDASAVTTVVDKLLSEINRPFDFGKSSLVISASVGISLYPQDSKDMEQLLQFADSAMYVAKKAGHNQYAFFEAKMQQQINRKYSIEQELRVALQHAQLCVYFQPIVDLKTGKFVGAEALVRWQHPEKGLILPDDFIPIAEECGLIDRLGLLVAESACIAATDWAKVSTAPLYVSLNKSVKQFHLDYHCKNLLSVLKASGLPPEQIAIEITESVLMFSLNDYLHILHKLRDQGIRIFLDDFGTGYSSLSYLKKLPIDKVKIDRSFVKDILTDENDLAMVDAIISMTTKLGIETIAEGIESADHSKQLERHGCRFGQGYYFAKPMPERDFLNFITRQQC